MRGRFALDPVSATIAGLHEHDHRLGDFSGAGFAARDAFVDEWLAKLEALPTEDLAPKDRVDRDLILADLRGDHALRPFARWRRQPTLYSDVITRAAYYAFLREHAPLAERAATLAERLDQAPAALEDAKRNLDPARVPVEWIAIALRTVPAAATFLRETAPALLPTNTALERTVARAFRPAAERAAAALDAYAEWLERELLPIAHGSFVIGPEATDAWLREKELLDYDRTLLRAWGKELVAETEATLARASRELGFEDWRAAIAELRADHPSEDQLVATYHEEMERSRLATATASVATLPYGEDLVVEEMPEFQRTTYPYAAYVGAGPFESSRRGRFWVTLPNRDDDESTRRERLEGHPRAGIPVIACHEGYPGHHLQLTVAADSASWARKALRSNLMVEGWGLYVEELMTEVGYLDAPATRLLRVKDLLWRACRVVVDVGLCTGETSFEEAVTFMVETAKLERPNALAEVRRYTLNPLQPSSYALGRAALLALRDKARKAGWGMRLFHDRVLAAGSLPPKLLERELGL